jgi:nucleotide-binding universal stress UspA family protein
MRAAIGQDVASTIGMRFTKILCATDFSPESRQALRVATRLAKESRADLVIAHAWYVPPSAYEGEYVFPAPVIQDMVAEEQKSIDAAVEEATSAGAPFVAGKLVSGAPWAEIVGLLEHEAFDLCVIGTRGRTGISRFLLGSVAEKVVRHAPCSVLAVHAGRTATPFAHALVPTDFSRDAQHALELADQLVMPGGRITLMHVIEVPVAFSGEVPSPEFASDLDRRAAAALERAAARFASKAGVSLEARSRIGHPGAQTLAALEDDPTFDLVVMGSHGRTGIKRALLGSVAEKVVRHAKCPVLVARDRR